MIKLSKYSVHVNISINLTVYRMQFLQIKSQCVFDYFYSVQSLQVYT